MIIRRRSWSHPPDQCPSWIRPISLQRRQLVLGKGLQHQVLELNFLGHLVGMQLQADRRFLDELRFGLCASR